jgi:hypothetical protein
MPAALEPAGSDGVPEEGEAPSAATTQVLERLPALAQPDAPESTTTDALTQAGAPPPIGAPAEPQQSSTDGLNRAVRNGTAPTGSQRVASADTTASEAAARPKKQRQTRSKRKRSS